MNRLKEVLDTNTPAIAVPILAETTDEIITDLPDSVDVFELRADVYDPANAHALIQKRLGDLAVLPTLLTVRSAKEGGFWQGSEAERLSLIKSLITEVDGVDVELTSAIATEVIAIAHENNKVVVGSYHNFTDTPPTWTLDALGSKALELDVDYVKVATTVTRQRELMRLTDFTFDQAVHSAIPPISVAMGPYGPMSRVTLPFYGSRLTYASADANPVANGQLGYKETRILLDTLAPKPN